MERFQSTVLLVVFVLLLALLLPMTWPESADGRVYEGEVWGDLRATGRIWGEQREPNGGVYVELRWSEDREMRAVVTNVSSVTLFDPPWGRRINLTVECQNRSFEIVPETVFRTRPTVMGDWWDVDFRCDYDSFNGTFEGTGDAYWPVERVSFVAGTALVRHDATERYDIYLSDCLVVVDGVEYENATFLFVPDDETATIDLEARGAISVGRGLFPHIDGTLEVDGFRCLDGWVRDEYQSIRFEGDHIQVRTTQSSSWFSHWGEHYDPWIIEVTASRGTEVEIVERAKLPLWFNYSLLGLLIALVAVTTWDARRRLRLGPDAD